MHELRKEFEQARDILDVFISDERNFEKIVAAGDLMVNCISSGGKILSCGNGGSMCDSMHFAQELTGLYREERESISAIAISDPSYITCCANDYGFENIFSRFVEGVGRKGDVLLAISTSGNSPNILKAAAAARDSGMSVVGLTGKGGGELGRICDVEIRVPSSSYADRVQEIHIKIIHSLILYIEKNL